MLLICKIFTKSFDRFFTNRGKFSLMLLNKKNKNKTKNKKQKTDRMTYN